MDASAPMITVARATATAEGIAIECREANAVELPFPEAAFDVVLCQSGLQFFPDRSASLREMRRVLKPGGRLILSVWGPIERSRGFAIAADAVARHIGPEAARPITLAFDLSHADELRALVTDANSRTSPFVQRSRPSATRRLKSLSSATSPVRRWAVQSAKRVRVHATPCLLKYRLDWRLLLTRVA